MHLQLAKGQESRYKNEALLVLRYSIIDDTAEILAVFVSSHVHNQNKRSTHMASTRTRYSASLVIKNND
jgi:hypothetical protein